MKIQDQADYEGVQVVIKEVCREWKIQKYCKEHHKVFVPGGVASMGIYCRLRSTNELAAVTHGHVAHHGVSFQYERPNNQGRVDLGHCIWPQQNPDPNRINMRDIAIVKLTDHQRIQELELARFSGKGLRVYDGERKELKNKKVFKVGAITGRKNGYIRIPQETFQNGNETVDGIIIQAEHSDDEYCKEGDSGAASLSGQLRRTQSEGDISHAISLVVGKWPDSGDLKNLALTTSIADGVQRFKHARGDDVIIDNDFGVFNDNL